MYFAPAWMLGSIFLILPTFRDVPVASKIVVKIKRATVWHEYPYPPGLQHFIEVPRPLFTGEGQAAQLLPAIFGRRRRLVRRLSERQVRHGDDHQNGQPQVHCIEMSFFFHGQFLQSPGSLALIRYYFFIVIVYEERSCASKKYLPNISFTSFLSLPNLSSQIFLICLFTSIFRLSSAVGFTILYSFRYFGLLANSSD